MLHSLRKTTHRDKSRNKKYVLAKLPPSLPNEVTVVVSKKTRAHTHKHALCTMRILLRMHVVFAHTWSQFCFTLVKMMLNTFHSWLKRDLRLVPSGPKGKVDRGLKLSEGHRERATAKRVWHLLERENMTHFIRLIHGVNRRGTELTSVNGCWPSFVATDSVVTKQPTAMPRIPNGVVFVGKTYFPCGFVLDSRGGDL